MDQTLTDFGEAKCPIWMKQMLDYMINMSYNIGCMKTPAIFFKKLFNAYRSTQLKYKATEPASEVVPMFLKYAECRIINIMYNKICEKFVANNTLTSPITLNDIESISNNDILSITCPTIFTGYHYIFAVVNNNKVDIYQSYGNRPLYYTNLDLNEFKSHLTNMAHIQGLPKDEALLAIKAFEQKIYLNDFDTLIHRQTDEDLTYDDVLNELYENFILKRENNFDVKVYKFNHSDCFEGGKRKRKTKKNRKLKYKKYSKRR